MEVRFRRWPYDFCHRQPSFEVEGSTAKYRKKHCSGRHGERLQSALLTRLLYEETEL